MSISPNTATCVRCSARLDGWTDACGNCGYVGKIGPGVGLMVFDAFLVLLSIIPFTWILTIPVWWIAFVCVAIHVSKEAKDFNHRNGIVVH